MQEKMLKLLEFLVAKVEATSDEEYVLVGIMERIEGANERDAEAAHIYSSLEISKFIGGNTAAKRAGHRVKDELVQMGILAEKANGVVLSYSFLEAYLEMKKRVENVTGKLNPTQLEYARIFNDEYHDVVWPLTKRVFFVLRDKQLKGDEIFTEIRKISDNMVDVTQRAVMFEVGKMIRQNVLTDEDLPENTYGIHPTMMGLKDVYRAHRPIAAQQVQAPTLDENDHTVAIGLKIIETSLAEQIDPSWDLHLIIARELYRVPMNFQELVQRVGEICDRNPDADDFRISVEKELEFLAGLGVLELSNSSGSEIWANTSSWRVTMLRHRKPTVNTTRETPTNRVPLFEVKVLIKGATIGITNIVSFYDTLIQLLAVDPAPFEVRAYLHGNEFTREELSSIADQIEQMGVIGERHMSERRPKRRYDNTDERYRR